LLSNVVGIAVQRIAYDSLSRFYESRGQKEKWRKYKQLYETGRLASHEALRELATPIETWSHLEKKQKIALTHPDPLWRKEACFSLLWPFVFDNPRARAEALQILRTVAQQDPDQVVRDYASACVPYLDGTKKAQWVVDGVFQRFRDSVAR
jgi:hypothetical protein